MADWDDPDLDDAYVDFLNLLVARDIDSLSLGYSAITNPPTGAIRYVRADDKFQEWNGSAWVDKILEVAGGGTGGAIPADARTNLGLGSISTQNANSVTITGGTLAGLGSLGLSGIFGGGGVGTVDVDSLVWDGIIPVANLGSGTPNADKVLKGDGSWGDFAMIESIQFLDITFSSAPALALKDFTLGTALTDYTAAIVIPGPGFYVIGGGDPATLQSAKLINNTTFRFTWNSAVINITIAGTLQIVEFRT